MRKYVEVEALARHLREGVHAGKAAAVVEKYAREHPTDAVAIGDPLPPGTVLEVVKMDDGSQRTRIKRYAELVEAAG